MKTVEQLLADWQSGALSPEELAQLKDALTKPAGRSELLWEWQLDEALYETLRAEADVPSTASPRVPRHSAVQRSAVPRAGVRHRRLFPWLVWRETQISWRLPAGIAIAACVLVAGLAVYYQEAAVAHVVTAPARATVEHDGRTIAAARGQALYPNDILRLPPETTGPAALTLGAEATRLELVPGAELRLLNCWRGKRVALRAGELRATVASQNRWRPMVLFTPQASAKVVGTQFSLSVTGAVTRLSVLEGAVRLRKTIRDSVDSLAEVLVQAGQVAMASRNARLETALLTGFLSSDTWLASPEVALTDAPSHSVTSAKRSPDTTSVRVERLRGYLVAPATGQFTFWLASLHGGSPAELWFSPNDEPSNKQRVAWVAGQRSQPPSTPTLDRGKDFRAVMDQEWRRFSTQRSAPLDLVQGRRYYIEIWHRGSGIDSLALGWTLPGAPADAPAPIDIHALCPFISDGPGKP